MPHAEFFTLIGLGIGFTIIGLAVFFWGKREEKHYYNSLTSKGDLREFISHWPERPQPKALKTGGWIAIAIGLAIILISIIRLLFAGGLI
jgi:CHASE3 domain sensor protein